MNQYAYGFFDLEAKRWVVSPRTFSSHSEVMEFTDREGKIQRYVKANLQIRGESYYEGVIDLSTGDWIFGFNVEEAKKIFEGDQDVFQIGTVTTKQISPF